MKIELEFADKVVSYCILTLCSYGHSGDYEAFPTIPLNLNPKTLAESFQSVCLNSVRFNETRVVLKFMESDITIFSSGRMIMEKVSPDSQRSAGNLISKLMAIVDKSNL